MIVYQDEFIVVAYKPPSILSQSENKKDKKSVESMNLKDSLSKLLGIELDLIHRLDRPCSG